MKIRLIEPEPPSVHIMSPWRYPRLGLPMIGAALKAAGHDVRIYCTDMAPVDWDDVAGADLVGLSTTTSTAPAGYAMADRLRGLGVPVVMGGAHVTFMADEALEHVDYVARGEGGDSLMLELIEALNGDRELDSIRGLSFMRDGRAVHNERRDACPDLDELPVPDLTLIAGHERMRSTPIMTSWGCPFGCSFCSVTAMFGRKYRYRSAESVVAEIEEKRPQAHLLLRRQLRRGREAAQDAAAADDRARRGDPVAVAGAHRRGARPRAARPHEALRLQGRGARAGVGGPGDARQPPQVADGRRHRRRHRYAARVRHPLPRHVRAGRGHRRPSDRPRHGELRARARHRHRSCSTS